MAYKPICSMEQWLDPDYGRDDPDYTCPRCGAELYEGDYIYKSIEDGEMICENCFEKESEELRKEVKKPEPDWDDMPGGADYCDW